MKGSKSFSVALRLPGSSSSRNTSLSPAVIVPCRPEGEKVLFAPSLSALMQPPSCFPVVRLMTESSSFFFHLTLTTDSREDLVSGSPPTLNSGIVALIVQEISQGSATAGDSVLMSSSVVWQAVANRIISAQQDTKCVLFILVLIFLFTHLGILRYAFLRYHLR